MSDAAEVGDSRGSRYRFVSRIATGGMAELYLGEATGIGGVSKRVALKRILPGHARDKEYLEMFLEEARLASTLQHPNIVQTYDVIRSGEDYVMVMEFLEGCDLYQLRRRLRASGQHLDLPHILYIALGVLSGLHYAHERRRTDGRLLGIVHRDVSPQNVFLTYDGGVKLLDFGIAKADTGLNRTESGVLKGKVLYMSPEQCGGRPMDRRADIYALGVVLYQLLTGTLPHRGKNAYDTMKSIIDTPVPRPSSINPRVVPALERIVLTALAKDPAARYATARDMQVELERFATDNGLFLSSVGFSTFVEQILGPRRSVYDSGSASPRALPPEIRVPVAEASHAEQSTLEQVLFEGPRASLRRIAGIQVLTLSGGIDETFDASSLSGHLKGEVIVDSSDVHRITSFGIRQIIALFNEAKPRITGLFHVRCSVAMISQVTMIRSLLGGGRILSFQVPLLDPVTSTSYTHVLAGQEAANVIGTGQLPQIPCPGAPSRSGEFDDDPDVYFNFAEDFLAEAPSHIGPALRALDEHERRLELELVVEHDGTTLFVRRPLREHDRWRRAMQGLEGSVRIDLSEVSSSDEPGVRSFVTALESSVEDIRGIRLVGTPLPLCAAMANSAPLRGIVTIDSVQVFGRCTSCGTERRLILAPAEAMHAASTNPMASRGRTCGRCSGPVVLISDLGPLTTWGATGSLAPRVTEGGGRATGRHTSGGSEHPPGMYTTGRLRSPATGYGTDPRVAADPRAPTPAPADWAGTGATRSPPTPEATSRRLAPVMGCALVLCGVLALAGLVTVLLFVAPMWMG
ncbi:MAG: protein kinase [Myxococcota bacterium]